MWVCAGHCGPVYGLTRNPFYPKFFLSAGDWSVRVWNEDLRTPVITSRFMPAHLTSCRWSPSRRALSRHPVQPSLGPARSRSVHEPDLQSVERML